jgi:hypothetical protein
MTKTVALKIVNPILGAVVLTQVLTGFLNGLMSRDVFETVHLVGGILIVIMVALHVTLNWPWIKATFFRPGQP